ncbi:hypothetical protein ACJIZ3_006819 [Penstemon smallii]|uniref:Cytochrome P450 n=1 Tax=Penstemon smallii TaxID=265156 RepID=A0ABD3S8R3_9LAMI
MDSSFPLAILISFLTILLIYKFLKKSKVVLPPGPRGLPILGYLPFIKSSLHVQIDEFARKYGPIFKFWLGSKLVVVINSPSLIKEVVRDKDAIFANHDAMASGIAATAGGINIVHSDYGPYWRHLRKLLARDMLSNQNLEASYGLRKEEVRKSTKHVYGKIGKAIDVGELIFVTEFNVIMSLMWGGTISEEAARDRIGKEFREKVNNLVELLARPNVSDYFPCLGRFDLQGIVKEMMGVVPGIEQTLTYVINKRKEMMMMMLRGNDDRNSVSKRKDFLEILLELTDENAEQPMNVTQIRVFLMVFI